MTNQYKSIRVLAPLTIVVMCFWYFDQKKGQKSIPVVTKVSPAKELKQHFRGPASVPPLSPIAIVNHTQNGPSEPQWKSNLERNLILQAGGTLKTAEIEKVDSFDWKVGNVPVKVDSLVVKLEHVKGYRSSFRAIVDSSNGKILQTWDHPVNDNFDPKTKFGIKIDSRYQND